jgi:hypothetical protein
MNSNVHVVLGNLDYWLGSVIQVMLCCERTLKNANIIQRVMEARLSTSITYITLPYRLPPPWWRELPEPLRYLGVVRVPFCGGDSRPTTRLYGVAL